MTQTPLMELEVAPSQAKDQEAKVEATWNRYWESVDAARLAAIYARLGESAPWYHRPFICGPREELAIISAALGELKGARTLEFGAGIGWTSLWLARAGAQTLVGDISSTALGLSRKVFARSNCQGAWTKASIFHPTADLGGRDLVFNSGLIEHFHRPDQVRLLANMQALARPGGHVIVFAPFAGGRVYQWAKRRMERSGSWRFGDEFPLHTMTDLGAEVGLELVIESTCKPGYQLNFLAGVSPNLARIAKLVYLATLADVTPLGRWCLGDSMLTTVFRRKP